VESGEVEKDWNFWKIEILWLVEEGKNKGNGKRKEMK